MFFPSSWTPFLFGGLNFYALGSMGDAHTMKAATQYIIRFALAVQNSAEMLS
jgi:hypothetical protein